MGEGVGVAPGGGGGASWTSSVRLTIFSWTGTALSRMRTLTTCGPVVAKVVSVVRVVASSNAPSLSVSHA